ncbi:CCR4-NOT transcription complex subunit 4 [Vitis vinifera]|uniref:CCR4-NOT transcription complex subunit 4 n=1 Tax=Vitis vinifera TaxID=29760 RepID=A0A438DW40_VITVI|nr:CCR4-NOT transcription complex subunit 4 [Vitis vinifera]
MCPLCTEEMDLTDQQLKPCKCRYEICVWCWHRILNEANSGGRCLACRSPYDEEKIVGMAAICGRSVVGINVEHKQKLQKAKWKAPEGRKDLNEDLLKRWEYFGQYGKVLKVSISRTPSGVIIQHFANKSCCV